MRVSQGLRRSCEKACRLSSTSMAMALDPAPARPRAQPLSLRQLRPALALRTLTSGLGRAAPPWTAETRWTARSASRTASFVAVAARAWSCSLARTSSTAAASTPSSPSMSSRCTSAPSAAKSTSGGPGTSPRRPKPPTQRGRQGRRLPQGRPQSPQQQPGGWLTVAAPRQEAQGQWPQPALPPARTGRPCAGDGPRRSEACGAWPAPGESRGAGARAHPVPPRAAQTRCTRNAVQLGLRAPAPAS
mmetsp:Transcript_110125/g.355454  ORF Transcript_110125/g.355454 Transcript_110125/m.355454 type:complete len:246 (+) Transcript_110125:622-1359(+)